MRFTSPSDHVGGCKRADLIDFAICSFCDASQELASIVDQRLTVDLEEWRLILVGNGLNGPSPTDIPLVHNKREKFRVVPTFACSLRTLADQC